jgi:acetyltransferase-like isoleucine patch superfamily enzyme
VKRVIRDELQDPASSHSLPPWVRLRSLAYLKWLGSDVQFGSGVRVGRHAQVKITNGGKLFLGARVILDDHSLVQLTKPKPTVRIGDYVVLGRFSIIAAKKSITIGRFTQIAPFCQILDQEHGCERNELIINQRSVLGEVVIGEDCWLGTGVTVLSNSSIGDGSVVGAGSVVRGTIPEGEIWAGVPARFIRRR